MMTRVMVARMTATTFALCVFQMLGQTTMVKAPPVRVVAKMTATIPHTDPVNGSNRLFGGVFRK
jgi:hypothetical protein